MIFFVILATKLGWQTGRNIETGTDSYAFKGNQWVGYDDKQTLRRKVSCTTNLYKNYDSVVI